MVSYQHLFSPITIAGRRIRNRIESAPMGAGGGFSWYTRDSLELYANMAKGGAGIVTLGEAGVDAATDTCHPSQPHLDSPDILPSLIQVVDAIHLWGAFASIELNHSGNRSNPKFVAAGADIMGPSAMTNLYGASVVEMNEDMMDHTADKFAYAAYMAQFAGMDIVNIHCGHGWLLGQFLSDLDNHRTDKYGGSLENKARFPLMVIDRIRQKCGSKLIIEIRISGDETVPGGITPEETVELAKLMDGKADIIHVSAATFHLTDSACRMFPTVFVPHACNAGIAARVKAAVKHSSVALVGGLSDPDIMESVLAQKQADLVVVGRAFLADPDFPRKAKAGASDQIIHCIRCCKCCSINFIPHVPFASNVIRCSVNPTLGREYETTRPEENVSAGKKVLVAGGGPAGMAAALTAARRGHRVILCEQSEKLGANLYYADGISFKGDLVAFRESMIANCARQNGLEVRLNTPVNAELIQQEQPDVLIAACGARPNVPPIPGVNHPKVFHVTDLFKRGLKPGHNVVIIGGGQAGCEEALALAEAGRQVTIVEMLSELARDAYFIHWKHMLRKIAENPNIRVLRDTQVRGIDDAGVSAVGADGTEEMLIADTVLIATGMSANNAMLDQWSSLTPDMRVVGDCENASRIAEAVRSGYCAGYSI